MQSLTHPTVNIIRKEKDDAVRIKIGLRNNRLISLRESLALTQKTLAKKTGIHPSIINEYECLRRKPTQISKKTNVAIWQKSALDLALFFNVDVEWLFPVELDKVKIRDIVVTGSVEKMPSYFLNNDIPPVLTGMDFNEKIELQKQIKKVMLSISPREEKVLMMRFFEDKTLEEVGRALGIGPARIRQIEAKGLRKLRRPSSSKYLKEFYE